MVRVVWAGPRGVRREVGSGDQSPRLRRGLDPLRADRGARGRPPGGAGFLFLFGRTLPFDTDTLERLYPGGPEEHCQRFEAATDAAVDAGFLLDADADEIRALARHGRQPSGWKTG